MPDSTVRLSLKYNGKDVDDGSMPLAEVVSALQGFAGAYGKVANTIAPESTHELRVTAVKQSSFELHILAWLTSQQGTTALHALEDVGKAAATVFGIIKGYIEVKKFLKGDGYDISVGDGNTRLVVRRVGESKEVPREVIDLLRSRTLEADLKKVVAPLEEGHVDQAEITATDEHSTQEVTVRSDEKGFFEPSVSETRESVDLIGTLVSNNKETLRGTFEQSDGTRFPYHYTGPSPEQFQSTYAYRGAVRVAGVLTVRADGVPKGIEVTHATRQQGELDL